MTTPEPDSTIPTTPPTARWTVRRDGPPTREGIRSLARLCLQIARQELAEQEQSKLADDAE